MTLDSAKIEFLVRPSPSVVRPYALRLNKVRAMCLSEYGGGARFPTGLLLYFAAHAETSA
jgi:hypothetical protein